jgi:hypothetical protein
MTSFLYRMPSGVPGEVTRGFALAVIEPQVITTSGTTGAPTAYGVPLVVDATSGNVGNMRTIATGDSKIYGVLVRPYPTGASQDALGTSTPPTVGLCDVLVDGYISVILYGSTAAAKGGLVYVWKAATTTGNHVQGGFEAADPTSNGFVVSGAYFTGPADANAITEIRVLG